MSHSIRPDAFVALQTHKKSRRPRAPFVEFSDAISTFFANDKFTFKSLIYDENLLNNLALNKRDLVLSFLGTQLSVIEMYEHCRGGVGTFRKIYYRIKLAKKFLKYRLKLQNKNFFEKELSYRIRMGNMTLGHLEILRIFVNSGERLAAVFEDDTEFVNDLVLLRDFYNILVHFCAYSNSTSHFFMNISNSFTIEELGVRHLLREEVNDLRMKSSQKVIRTLRPFTNTTSALIYSRHFAQLVLSYSQELLSRKLYKHLPYDMLLNLIITRSFGQGMDIKCFHNLPGMFRQGSLHLNW